MAETEATPFVPCPFCGGDPGKRDLRDLGYPDRERYMIACSTCVVGFHCETWKQAIIKWNTRTATNENRTARLEEALRRIAAFDDKGASEHLVQTGSYSRFDEPGSVEIARAALSEEE